jgi:hypothetical protein
VHNNFEIKTCPLCQQVLKFRQVSGVDIFDCSTTFTFNSYMGATEKSHYEVQMDKAESIQHVYVLPWAIDNISSLGRARLYKIYTSEGDELSPGIEINKWRFIKELPPIHPDQNLLERINCLVNFL